MHGSVGNADLGGGIIVSTRLSTTEPFARNATGLVREIGVWVAVALTFNQIVGGGIYAFSVQQSFQWPGSSPAGVLLLATIPVLLLALVYTWLATAMPRAGGDYVFLSRLVHPAVGWLLSWLMLSTRVFLVGTLMFADVQLWGASLSLVGLTLHATALEHFGSYLGTSLSAGIVGAIVLALTVFAFLSLGGRAFSWYVAVLFVIPVLGGIATIIVFLAHPYSAPSLRSVWNSIYGSGAYQEIVRVAHQTGWHATGVSFSRTLAAINVGIFAFAIAPWTSATFGGEIKRPQRSFWIAIVGSTILAAIFMAILAVGPTYSTGQFVSMYNWVYYTPAAHKLMTINPGFAPTITLFVLPFAHNPILLILLAIGGAISLYHVAPSAVLAGSRYILAMSFDRYFPEWLSGVSERFHTPIRAIGLLTVGGILGVFLNYVYGWTTGLSAFSSVVTLIWAGVSVAGFLFPWRMPDVYNTVRVQVLGVPLIQIVSALSFLLSAYLFVQVTVTATPASLWMTLITTLAGVIVYAYYYWRNARLGVTPAMIYSELPPE